LKAFRKLADLMLGYDDLALAAAMKNGTITEIMCHGQAVSQQRPAAVHETALGLAEVGVMDKRTMKGLR